MSLVRAMGAVQPHGPTPVSEEFEPMQASLGSSLVAASQSTVDYVPVLIMFLLAIGFAVFLISLSWVLGRKSAGNPVKDTAYECGLPPITEAHQRFSVKFYLVALLFVLFDIEVVFLYPWAVSFRSDAAFMGFLLAEMTVFAGILFLGWYYVIRKGVVDWARD